MPRSASSGCQTPRLRKLERRREATATGAPTGNCVEFKPRTAYITRANMRPVTGDFNHKNPLDWFLVKRAAVVPAFRPGTLDRFKKVIHAI